MSSVLSARANHFPSLLQEQVDGRERSINFGEGERHHGIRGAAEVAGRALTFADLSPFVRPVLVNGVAGRPRRSPGPDRLERIELGA